MQFDVIEILLVSILFNNIAHHYKIYRGFVNNQHNNYYTLHNENIHGLCQQSAVVDSEGVRRVRSNPPLALLGITMLHPINYHAANYNNPIINLLLISCRLCQHTPSKNGYFFQEIDNN